MADLQALLDQMQTLMLGDLPATEKEAHIAKTLLSMHRIMRRIAIEVAYNSFNYTTQTYNYSCDFQTVVNELDIWDELA